MGLMRLVVKAALGAATFIVVKKRREQMRRRRQMVNHIDNDLIDVDEEVVLIDGEDDEQQSEEQQPEEEPEEQPEEEPEEQQEEEEQRSGNDTTFELGQGELTDDEESFVVEEEDVPARDGTSDESSVGIENTTVDAKDVYHGELDSVIQPPMPQEPVVAGNSDDDVVGDDGAASVTGEVDAPCAADMSDSEVSDNEDSDVIVNVKCSNAFGVLAFVDDNDELIQDIPSQTDVEDTNTSAKTPHVEAESFFCGLECDGTGFFGDIDGSLECELGGVDEIDEAVGLEDDDDDVYIPSTKNDDADISVFIYAREGDFVGYGEWQPMPNTNESTPSILYRFAVGNVREYETLSFPADEARYSEFVQNITNACAEGRLDGVFYPERKILKTAEGQERFMRFMHACPKGTQNHTNR